MDLRALFIETHIHMPPPLILADIDQELAARRFPGVAHSIGEIVSHLAFWQGWFLKRICGEAEPFVEHAQDGWPAFEAGKWETVRTQFLQDLEKAASSASGDEALDKPIQPPLEFPPMANFTVREALVHIATHNSHHLGEVIILCQIAGAWPPKSGSWTW